ncbi:MAG: cell division protein ZapA [Oscillospiraceae bacterium]|nr:cell division protein ZapA [Oscillospiraceae bacterium]
MKQKIPVDIAGIQLSLISEEDEEYVINLAKQVDERVRKITMSNTRRTKTEATIFCAIDYLDEKLKTEIAMKKLSDQINGYKRDIEELKKENDELKKLLDG